MKRSSPRNARLALRALLSISLLGILARTSAETVAFPQGKSVFSVVFPDSWNAQMESNGTLTARPNDKSAVQLTLLTLEGIANEKAASTALVRMSEQIAKATDISAFKKGEVTAYRTEKNLPCLHLESRGKDRAGADVVLTTIVFSPDDRQYFVLVARAAPAAEKAHESELVGIVQSIEGD